MPDTQEEKTYPLHKAIKCRNTKKIKKLLSHVNNINEKNSRGYPALVYACEQENNDEMLEILFEQRNIDPKATEDFEGQNALHVLAFKGQLKWIEKYFEKFPQVPVDVTTGKGDTALILAAKMDHSDVIEYLHKKKANINHKNEKKFTALHYASNNGYTVSTKKILELGADIDALDDRGYTPLTKACSWGFEETCKILIEKGANVAQISDDKSPLIGAVRRRNLEIARILLNSGADPNFVVKKQFTIYTALGSACKNKDIEAMELLIEKGADVNSPGPYSIALFICVKGDFPEGVQELIRAGVSLTGRHPQSKLTALETAKKYRKSKIVNILQRCIPSI